MKHKHLHIVTDKDHKTHHAASPTVAAEIDFQRLLAWGSYYLTMIGLVLMLPFRLIASIWRIGVATGVGFVQGIIKLAFGIFGLALICWLSFGLIRVIFHPLFR